MLYRRKQPIKEGDIVICTVKDVHPHSVFVHLDEFNMVGMIHISEIAPGRVRNIKDYVDAGKKIICKVLKERGKSGHLDLSFRRVNESQRRDKNNKIKKEKKAEKLLEALALECKLDMSAVYKQISSKLLVDYEYIHEFFEELVAGQAQISEAGLGNKEGELLEKLIRDRVKETEVVAKYILHFTTYASEGIEHVKKALKVAEDKAIVLQYLGNGRYLARITAKDYPTAEDLATKKVNQAVDLFNSFGGQGSAERLA